MLTAFPVLVIWKMSPLMGIGADLVCRKRNVIGACYSVSSTLLPGVVWVADVSP